MEQTAWTIIAEVNLILNTLTGILGILFLIWWKIDKIQIKNQIRIDKRIKLEEERIKAQEEIELEKERINFETKEKEKESINLDIKDLEKKLLNLNINDPKHLLESTKIQSDLIENYSKLKLLN